MRKLNCVLLIDDDEPTNFLNKLTLKKMGCVDNIVTAFDGQEALNYLTEHQRGNPPELIFLDINMPLMNGWEFLEEYQLLSFDNDPPVVIMLTTSINPDDEEKSKKYSTIAGFMHKPLELEEINKLIEKYFN